MLLGAHDLSASSPELLSGLRRSADRRWTSTLVGRAALEGRPIGIADIAAVERDAHLQLLYEDGWRSVLAVPVLRDGQIIGAHGGPAEDAG